MSGPRIYPGVGFHECCRTETVLRPHRFVRLRNFGQVKQKLTKVKFVNRQLEHGCSWNTSPNDCCLDSNYLLTVLAYIKFILTGRFPSLKTCDAHIQQSMPVFRPCWVKANHFPISMGSQKFKVFTLPLLLENIKLLNPNHEAFWQKRHQLNWASTRSLKENPTNGQRTLFLNSCVCKLSFPCDRDFKYNM